jgi:hypothetical protein
MAAFNAFWRLDIRNLHSTNNVFLTLLPKSLKAASIKDYHPISLIHLTPRLEKLIHPS